MDMSVKKFDGIDCAESLLPGPLEQAPLGDIPSGMTGVRLQYTVDDEGKAPAAGESGTVSIDTWTFTELAALSGMDAAAKKTFTGAGEMAIQPGGWQSWSAGWELMAGETLPARVRLIPELLKQTNREGDTSAPPGLPDGLGLPNPLVVPDRASAQTGKPGMTPQDPSVLMPQASPAPVVVPSDQNGPLAPAMPGKGWLAGHFITYLRVGETYLCIASRDGGGLPPVSFRIHREQKIITAEVFCPGKTWKTGELMAELTVFRAQGYFNFKDTIRLIYQQGETFKALSPLVGGGDRRPGGYESWYNHYTDINEKLILEDLEGLGQTENLIKRWYLDQQKPVVFQIDDGWEKAVGEWEVNTQRFPNGLSPVAAAIEAAGCIPGLWLAPFLVTRRSRIFTERPGWLLRDREGQPVVAGFNNKWDRQFYCLDLSRKDVLDYLGKMIDRAIDEWGFRYLKLDFLYAGLLSGAFAEKGSPYEYYERACTVLTARNRTASGLPVAYLGCGCPLGPSYRHFPLSRIGADTKESWAWKPVNLIGHVGGPGAYVNLQDTIGRSFMDGAVYINDPDVIFLRSQNCKLTENEKELIALVNYLLGGQIMFSDAPRRLTAADTALTRRVVALYEALAGDEYGATRIARDVFRLESRSGKTAGLINLGKRPFVLEQETDAALFKAVQVGSFLTDHRVRVRGGGIGFAGHTISVTQR